MYIDAHARRLTTAPLIIALANGPPNAADQR
jgi:hypothetical protein